MALPGLLSKLGGLRRRISVGWTWGFNPYSGADNNEGLVSGSGGGRQLTVAFPWDMADVVPSLSPGVNVGFISRFSILVRSVV